MKLWLGVIIVGGVLGARGFAAEQGPEVLNLDEKITIRAEDVTLVHLLELWDRATGMQSTIPQELENRKLTIRFTGLNVNDALRKIFEEQPFGYFLIGGRVVVTAPSESNPAAERAPADEVAQVTEEPALPETARLKPEAPPPLPPLPQQPTVIPTPFGPILSLPGSRQPFTQLPPVYGAPPAPPFFAPSLPTIPPAGAANGPVENRLFGPLPIYQSPNLPPLNPQQGPATP